MARDATARLYDVDAKTLTFERSNQTGKYDHGDITFYAKEGKLVDLAKLHESVWATRLSGGTRSGVVRLEVTAVGVVAVDGRRTVLRVAGSDKQFVLRNDPKTERADGGRPVFQELRRTAGESQSVRVTGTVEGWRGRWPSVLSRPPAEEPTLRVARFEIAKE